PRRVIQTLEVHELVDHHVVAYVLGHQHEPPVEADVAVWRARSPPPFLVTDADAVHAQPAARRQLVQPRGQLALGARAHPDVEIPRLWTRGHARLLDAPPLAFDPGAFARGELGGLALRSPPRHGDLDLPVIVDAKHVPPRARMPDEHEIDRR